MESLVSHATSQETPPASPGDIILIQFAPTHGFLYQVIYFYQKKAVERRDYLIRQKNGICTPMHEIRDDFGNLLDYEPYKQLRDPQEAEHFLHAEATKFAHHLKVKYNVPDENFTDRT